LEQKRAQAGDKNLSVGMIPENGGTLDPPEDDMV
jgi:hypothetical protein